MTNWPIYVYSEQDTIWASLIFFEYLIFTNFLLTKQMCQWSEDVPLKINSEMEWENVGTVETCPSNNISNCPEIALSLVRNTNSIVDVKVWIMGSGDSNA
jgi:hypothetical protein